MIVTCEFCATRYNLESHLVKSSGSKVKCSKCLLVFRVFPSDESDLGGTSVLSDSSGNNVNGAQIPTQTVDADSGALDSLDLSEVPAESMGEIQLGLQSADKLAQVPVNELTDDLSDSSNWNSGDADLPELADELDKILGPDDSDDGGHLEGGPVISDDSFQVPLTEEVDSLDLSELDEDLEQLGNLDDSIDDESTSSKEYTASEPAIRSHDEIEVLDLSELEDEFEDLDVQDESIQPGVESGIEFESAEVLSFEETEAPVEEETEDFLGSLTETDVETDPDLEMASLLSEQGDAGVNTPSMEAASPGAEFDESVVEETDGGLGISLEESLESLDDSELGSGDTISEELSEPEEDPGLDTHQIESFDLDLDNLEEVTPLADESTVDEISVDGSSFESRDDPLEALSQDSDAADTFHQELDDLEALISPTEEELPDDSSDKEEGDASISDVLDVFDNDSEDLEGLIDPEEEAQPQDRMESVDLDSPVSSESDLLQAEPDSLDAMVPGADEVTTDEKDEGEEDFILDTIQIESFDQELDNLDNLITPTEDAALDAPLEEEATDESEISSVDLDKVSLFDEDSDNTEVEESTGDEIELEEVSAPEEGRPIDSEGIDSLDLDLDNLDELNVDDIETEPLEESTGDDRFVLDTQQIESLSLELENVEDLGLGDNNDPSNGGGNLKDDFILDSQQIDSLDLELKDDEVALEKGDLDDDIDMVLDTDQIKALNLELEDSDMQESADSVKDSGRLSQKPGGDHISMDSQREKTAEVLNLNLERPDLDDSSQLEEGIDLPILDELLAPAEVVDETLVDKSFELGGEASDAAESDLADALEGAPAKDSLPILELDDIDKQVDLQEKEDVAEPALAIEDAAVQPALEEDQGVTQAEVKEEAQPAPKPLAAAPFEKFPADRERFETIPKQRTSKSLVILAAVALLLALFFGLNAMGIKIPGLSDLNIPYLTDGGNKISDQAGSAKIKTADISSKFVTNKKSGKLFVISGSALNQYDHKRGSIRIKGNIYATGGKLVATQWSMAGHSISDSDLTSKQVDIIQGILTHKSGAGKGADSMEPG